MANFKRNTLSLALSGIILTLGGQSAAADEFDQIGSGLYSTPFIWSNRNSDPSGQIGVPGVGDAVHFHSGSVLFDQNHSNLWADVDGPGTITFDLQSKTYSLTRALNIQGGALNAVGGSIFSNGGNVNNGGAVTLGANTQWSSTFTERSDFRVNSGDITVQDGAKIMVDSGTTAIGVGIGGFGTVLVTGTGSEFSNSGQNGEFLVGFEGGSGQLSVLNGGQVFSGGSATIGSYEGSTGQVTVSGIDSNWTGSSIGIGDNSGTGTLTVEGLSSLNTSYLGVRKDSSVTVDNASIDATQGVEQRTELVEGGLLTLKNNSQFGTAGLLVTGAGSLLSVETGSTATANNAEAREGGKISVDGSTLNAFDLRAGAFYEHTGTLTFSDNAQVNVGGRLFSEGTITVDNSTITVSDKIEGTGGSITTSGNAQIKTDRIDLWDATVNTQDSAWQLTHGGFFNGGSYTQISGSFSFGDGFSFGTSPNGPATINLQDGAILRHQNFSTSDNQGFLFVRDNSTLNLTNSTVDLTTGDQGFLNIQGGATFNVVDSVVNAKSVTIESGSVSNLTSGTVNVTAGDLKIDQGTLDASNSQASTVEVSLRIEMLNNGQMLLKGDQVTVGGPVQVYSGSDVNSVASNVAVGTKLDVAGVDSSWIQSGGSVTSFGDELWVTGGATLTSTGSSITQSGAGRGDVIINNNGSLVLDSSTLDSTDGTQKELKIETGGALQTSNNSNVNVNRVRIDGAGSKATFDHSTLIAQSLALTDHAFFEATLSTINITGNTTTIDATSQMILNDGTYDEAGDFIIDGKLTGTNPIINIGSDLIINNGGSVEFSGLASLLIGDDLLFFGHPGPLNLGSTTITMQGLLDDDSNGFQFNLGSTFSGILDLGKLIIGAVDLILKGNFNISELILPGTATIRLADNSTLTVNRFTGNESSITGGTFNNNTPAVPEPTTLLLFGMGLLGLLGFRRFRKIG